MVEKRDRFAPTAESLLHSLDRTGNQCNQGQGSAQAVSMLTLHLPPGLQEFRINGLHAVL